MSPTKEQIIKAATAACKDNLMETLNIEFVDAGEDFVIAKMPVDKRVYQSDGVLHGEPDNCYDLIICYHPCFTAYRK